MSEPMVSTVAKDSGEPIVFLTDPRFLEDLRTQMLRFATLQLSDGSLAEDAVQEALLGALRNARSFGGKAAFKTWVFAILKNKIADVLRHNQRLVTLSNTRPDADDDELSLLFDQTGSWYPDARPRNWGDPDALMSDVQFWRIFALCLDALPPNQGRAFMMREFVELESHEICAALGISQSNLFVLLHRARLRLGKCLEQRWFATKELP